MKCGYCGKKVSGNARYCSEYCRKKGEAKANFAHKTRIPLAVILILAVIAAAVGIVLIAAGKINEGGLFFALGLVVLLLWG